MFHEKCIKQPDRKKQEHLILYFLVEVRVCFSGFAEAVYCSCCSFQVFAAFSSSFLCAAGVSGMWWEHMQTDRVRCPERRSLQLGFNLLVFIAKNQPWLISSKSSLLRVLCWLGHLSSSVLLSWHFQLPPSALKSVLLSVRSSGQGTEIQLYCMRWFQARCLKEGGSAQLIFLCLGAFPPRLLCGCFGLMGVLNQMRKEA